MEEIMIKNTIKVGNSAGVLLPRKYLNSRVKITLEPLDIEKDILEILAEKKLLKDVLGVYLVGSYARKEETIESDVDILVITQSTDKRIKEGKYEIICVSEKEIKIQLKKNILPIASMIKEAVTIINENVIKQYINVKLTLENLKFHIETTKSAMEIIKKDIGMAKSLNEKNTSDEIAYSLILRLRTLYIIDCIKKNKLWNKKEFLELIKSISGSLNAYNGYLRSKNSKKVKSGLSLEEAEKLMNYINKNTEELEKWARE